MHRRRLRIRLFDKPGSSEVCWPYPLLLRSVSTRRSCLHVHSVAWRTRPARRIGENAVINANYLRARLADYYDVLAFDNL